MSTGNGPSISIVRLSRVTYYVMKIAGWGVMFAYLTQNHHPLTLDLEWAVLALLWLIIALENRLDVRDAE